MFISGRPFNRLIIRRSNFVCRRRPSLTVSKYREIVLDRARTKLINNQGGVLGGGGTKTRSDRLSLSLRCAR